MWLCVRCLLVELRWCTVCEHWLLRATAEWEDTKATTLSHSPPWNCWKHTQSITMSYMYKYLCSKCYSPPSPVRNCWRNTHYIHLHVFVFWMYYLVHNGTIAEGSPLESNLMDVATCSGQTLDVNMYQIISSVNPWRHTQSNRNNPLQLEQIFTVD